jgi:hypothetical protein
MTSPLKKNKVYLLKRNIEITRLSNKLNYKKFGLFRIKYNIRDINYKLELFKIIRIYLVFYILLLKSVNLKTLKGLIFEFYPNI